MSRCRWQPDKEAIHDGQSGLHFHFALHLSRKTPTRSFTEIRNAKGAAFGTIVIAVCFAVVRLSLLRLRLLPSLSVFRLSSHLLSTVQFHASLIYYVVMLCCHASRPVRSFSPSRRRIFCCIFGESWFIFCPFFRTCISSGLACELASLPPPSRLSARQTTQRDPETRNAMTNMPVLTQPNC